MSAEQIAFWVFAPISVGSAIGMLLQRNAVHAALLLVVNLVTVAVFYLMLDAPFLFAVQIIVYAGAIMVLFLFVIMLLGVDREEALLEPLRWQRTGAVVLGLAVLAELVTAIHAGVGFAARGPAVFAEGASTRALARTLFRSYLLPFEATSVLLIVAAVAAMVLAHRKAPAPPAEAATTEPEELEVAP